MSLSIETKKITQYYANRTMYKPKDLERVSDEILYSLNSYYEKHNEESDVEWPKLKNVNHNIVVYIIQGLFIIKRIQLCEDILDSNYILGIFVDSYLTEIIPALKSDSGIYLTDPNIIKSIALYFNPEFSTNQLKEIYTKLFTVAPIALINSNVDLIPMKSNIFNYKTKKTLDFNPDYVFLHKNTIDYNANAESPIIYNENDEYTFEVMSWLLELANNEEEIQNLFIKIISAAMRPGVKFDKAVFLISSRGNNGKGSFVSVIRSILGIKACANLQISDFSKEFHLNKLITASAVVADENDVDENMRLNKCANFKAAVTQDVIHIDRKFLNPIDIRFMGLVIQCCNSFIFSSDRTDSFYRRLLFVPMMACFTGKEKKYIREDYLKRPEVLEYLVKVALETDFYSFDGNTPKACKRMLNDYMMKNDTVLQFWNDTKHSYVWDILPYSFLYDVYSGWFKECRPTGQLLGKHSFIDKINEIIAKSESQIWESTGKKQRYVKNGWMSQPEMLIDKYNLKKWESDYKGKDIRRKCVPKDSLRQKHAGLVRVKKNCIYFTD